MQRKRNETTKWDEFIKAKRKRKRKLNSKKQRQKREEKKMEAGGNSNQNRNKNSDKITKQTVILKKKNKINTSTDIFWETFYFW